MHGPLTVIGLGCELDRLFSDQRPAAPLPGPVEREDVRLLYDTIAAPLRQGETVLVIVGTWLPQETLERVQIVHSLLETDRVAVHMTELPPLAASVLAALAAALSPYAVSAGALAGSLDAIAAELIVLAWAGSVAGLRHPGVSLFQHARSALPWTTFGIGLQPESFVQAITKGAAEPPLQPPAEAIELLVAPGENAELSWIVEVVAPALGGVAVRELPGTLHGAEWWGTTRLVEAVGVPVDLERLARVAIASEVLPCSWCGEPIPGPPCPFCRAVDESQAARPQTSGLRSPAATLAPGRALVDDEHGS